MKSIYKILIFILPLITCITPSRGQTIWSPTAGSNWNTAGNWSFGIPTSATVAQFNANPTSGSVTLNAAANAAAINITSAHTVTLTITNSALSSNSITLSGANINGQANTVLANNAGGAGTLIFKTGGTSMTVNTGSGNYIVAGAGTSLTHGNTISITSSITGTDATFLGGGTWTGATGLNGGALKLSGSNASFTGTVTVGSASSTYNSGILELAATGALPAGADVVVNPYSQVYLNASGTFTGGALTLNATGNNASAYGRGALRSSASASQWSGDVIMNSDAVIFAGGTLTLAGNMSGSGRLRKEGTGGLVIKGTANTFTGDVSLSKGSITVASGSSLGSGNNVLFNPAAGVNITLTLNNTAQTIGSLASSFDTASGAFTNTLILATGTTLTIDQASNTTFGAGSVATLKSIITGNATIVKKGVGRLTLNSPGSTFYGGLTILSGDVTFCPSASTTLGTGSNFCPLNMSGGTFRTTGITASVVCSLGVFNNISNSTLALDSLSAHSLIFTGLGINTGLLTVTGWKGSFNGITGTKGKLFIGSSAALTSAQLAQIQFTDGARIVPATQLSTGEVVPMAPIDITPAAYGPFSNDVANTISVAYSTPASYFTGVFKVQLSSATGIFSNFTSNIIGTGTNATSGTISATIPAYTSGGLGYRVRVVNSSPYSVGSDNNGTDILLNNALPVVSSVSDYSALPGDTITVTGSMFDTVLNNNLVYFGPVKMHPVSGSTISLRVPVPFGATLGPVSVYDTSSRLTGSSSPYFEPGYNNVFFESHSISFQPRQDYTVKTCPNIAAVGDLDGDNLPDLVTVNKISRNISILQNTGGGIAAYDTVLVLGCQGNPSNVKIADIDGDGRQDIIVAGGSGGSTIMVFRNTTNFTGAAPRTLSFATRSDILINSVSTHPGVLGIGDFDNDGRLDIAAACYAPSSPFKMVILRNNNNPGATNSFTLYGFNTGTSANPSLAATSSMCVGDFNSDGLTDIAVVTQNYTSPGTLSIFKNTTAAQGDINFSSPLALSTGAFPLDVQCGDMDGDGKLDLITTQSIANSVSIFRNTYVSPAASLSFAGGSVITTALSTPAGVAIGDLDGDGKLDIAASNFVAAGGVTLLRNNSSEASFSFIDLGNLATDPYPAGITIADLDKDGYPEVISGNTGNNAGNTISIFRNTPVPVIGAITPASPVVCVGAPTTLSYSLTIPNGETAAWTSSNTGVATVDAASGAVYGVTAGNATITYTVTVTNGNISRYTVRAITVNALPAVSITGFRNVCQGGTTTLTGTPVGGSWSHANAVATVSASGAVTGVAASGTDIITYSYTAGTGCSNIDTHAISIIPPPNVGTVSGADSFCVAATSLYTSSGDAGGRWYSSSPFVVSIDSMSGLATGVSDGYINITYRLTSGCGTYDAVKLVLVKALPEMANISDPSLICVGSSISLDADVAGGTWSSSDPSSATVNGAGIVTGLATGTPNISYTLTNECGTTSSYTGVTVNDVPGMPAAITGTTTVCFNSSTTLSDATTGGAWTSSNTLLATVSNAGVVYGVAAGNPQISYTISNTCGVSAPSVTTVSVLNNPVADITSAPTPCTGHSADIIFTGTNGAVVAYNIDGGSNVNATLTGGTYSLATGAITTSHIYQLHTVSNAACTLIKDTAVTLIPQLLSWVGGAAGMESDWSTAANWSCGIVPGVTDDIMIPATGYVPVLAATDTGNTHVLSIASNAGLVLNVGSILNVKGILNNNGSISGPGVVILNGSSAQAITGNGVVGSLQLVNSAGAAIDSGSKLVVTRELSVVAGVFSTHDSLELASSDTSGSARIAALPTATSISGRVRVDQYIQGNYRRYRFWSHPFAHSISLSQPQQFIDITGPGGAGNGFTPTSTNAPSAFRYDPYSGNATAGYDPGWKPFTKINMLAADSNLLHRHQGIRLFIRGAKGQGLGYGAYVPLPVTIKMFGYVNQGPQTVILSKGLSDTAGTQEYNMVGDPYPSPVDIGTVVYNAQQSGNINGSAIYVWNASLGVAGQYLAIPIGPSPYFIQANSCFQVRAAHNGDSLNFTEADKGPNANTYLFKGPEDYVTLNVYDKNYHLWDMMRVQFNDKATDKNDRLLDATKLMSGDFNFYSLSADNRKLTIDARPYDEGIIIPLGITSAYQQDMIIRAESIAVPAGGTMILHDKLNGKYVTMAVGTEYPFTIGKDAHTQGDDRFELLFRPTLASAGKFEMSMSPNPATDKVVVTFTSGVQGSTTVRVNDVNGVTVYSVTAGEMQNGQVPIDIGQLAPGTYLVELIHGNDRSTQKLVKE